MSSNVIISQKSEFVHWIIRQLSMEPNKVRAFSLHAAVNEPVTVDVTYYPEDPGDDLECKTFKLTWEEVEE